MRVHSSENSSIRMKAKLLMEEKLHKVVVESFNASVAAVTYLVSPKGLKSNKNLNSIPQLSEGKTNA